MLDVFDGKPWSFILYKVSDRVKGVAQFPQKVRNGWVRVGEVRRTMRPVAVAMALIVEAERTSRP